MMKKIAYVFLFFVLAFILCACGFQLQGKTRLAGPLHRVYIQASDKYGHLVRYLEQYLKMSDAIVVNTPAEASTIFSIMKDEATQELISVSSTQQTRQYNLKVTVIFQITDNKGRILVSPQTISENRVITVQASQILGSDNQTNMIYQQMRRMIAYAIMVRIASNQVTRAIENNYVVFENGQSL
jgi:LPS-assembly lipoprotein